MIKKINRRKRSLVSRCPLTAAASFVDDYNISEIARCMGVSEKVLLSKLNFDCETHHLNLQQAIAMAELTNDTRVLQAWATSQGKMLVDAPEPQQTDAELSDQLLNLHELFGDFAREFKRAREDGIITEEEYLRIHKKAVTTTQALLGISAEIKQMIRTV